MAGLWRLIIDLHADKQKERTQLMEPRFFHFEDRVYCC